MPNLNRHRTPTRQTIQIANVRMGDLLASRAETVKLDPPVLDALRTRCRGLLADARDAAALALIASDGVPPEVIAPVVSRTRTRIRFRRIPDAFTRADRAEVLHTIANTKSHTPGIEIGELLRVFADAGIRMRAHGEILVVNGGTAIKFPKPSGAIDSVQVKRVGSDWQNITLRSMACAVALAMAVAL